MTESTVISHIGYGIAVIDNHIQIRQRAEHGAIQQRLTPLPAAEQCALNTGTKYRLGYRVHD